MELYYVLSIVDRDRADTLISLQQKLNLSLMFANLGEGTAREEHLSLHNLEPSEKAIVSTLKRSLKPQSGIYILIYPETEL